MATGDEAGSSLVPNGPALGAFAEALVGRDDPALLRARERVRSELGPAGLVDAAAVASNFERMVRIADATGIPLDRSVAALSADLRDALELDRFASSAQTRRLGWLGSGAAAALRAAFPFLLRRLPRRAGR